MATSSQGLADSVRAFLRRDHARLDGLLDRFRDEQDGADPRVRLARWRDFEAALLGHMAAEEKHLLVAFARVQPEEAATLRAQHAELRQLLAVAGPSLQADGDAWMALTGALRAHASQEDSMFYVWAERTDGGAAEGLIRDVSERSGEVDLAQRH